MSGAHRLSAAGWMVGGCLGFLIASCDRPAQAPHAPAPAPQAGDKPSQEASASTGVPGGAKVVDVVKAVAKDLPLPPDLVQFQAEIARASAQIDLVLSRLEVLAGSTKDLEKPHEAFQSSLAALDAETAGLRKRADEMRDKGAAYFEAWEKGLASISTPEVKAVALKRKAELSAQYTELLTAMQEARAAYDPFAAGLKEIQTRLDDSLSPESLKDAAAAMVKTKEGAKTLKDRIAGVVGKLGSVSGIYSTP